MTVVVKDCLAAAAIVIPLGVASWLVPAFGIYIVAVIGFVSFIYGIVYFAGRL